MLKAAVPGRRIHGSVRREGGSTLWGGHDLSALPEAGYSSLSSSSKGGGDSYTMAIDGAKIEVHLKRKAFFLLGIRRMNTKN